ncbi:hypothetical protein JVU11DRAFT_3973 [Chiua virens]|nr:hypothetical protein JVU11DRAFT_3973 [Chiua virens]
MPIFNEQALDLKLNAALATFHSYKDAIISAGGHSKHFRIPKLKLMQHVVPSICVLGAPMQWSADITEHAHVTEIKHPARAGNNQNYYAQIACHLDHSKRCFRFDLATAIASSHHHPENNNDPADDEDHEPDNEKIDSMLYYSPTRKVLDYFKVADMLINDMLNKAPHLRCTFMSGTTAIHLTIKPHHWMTIKEATTLFKLPDLCPAIHDYLDRCTNGIEHSIGSQRHASSNSSLPSNRIQIWTKIHVQTRNYHDTAVVEPAQTMNIAPPSQEHPCGLYDSTVFSTHTKSDWPSSGLNGHVVVQFQIVFCMLGMDEFLTYVQHFNVTSPTLGHTTDVNAAGLHALKHATRINGDWIGDVLPVSYLRSPVYLVPCFGKNTNSRLTKHTSHKLSNKFWLNHYWNKQIYYSLSNDT